MQKRIGGIRVDKDKKTGQLGQTEALMRGPRGQTDNNADE